MAAIDFPTSPTNNQVYSINGKSWQYSTALASWQSITASPVVRSFHYVIDGGGAAPATGVYGQLYVPIACTVTGWILTADQTGSCTIDVLRSTYSGFPTTSSIAGTDKPTLAPATQKNQNLAISAWGSTALAAGDQLQFSLTAIGGAPNRINITLLVTVP